MSTSRQQGTVRQHRSRWRALALSVSLLAVGAALAVPLAPAAVAAPAAGQFVPVSPVTVVNAVSVPAGGTFTFTVTGANGIPAAANVSAVALAVVAVQPAADGWLQVYPAGPRPSGNSTVDYQQGRSTAAFEVVPTSASGQVSVFSTAATRVLVRLRGYYTSAASTVTGGSFVPVPPATVANSVDVAAGGTFSFTATGANGIPASPNVTAVALAVVAIQPAATGWLQVYQENGAGRPPNNSTIDYRQGQSTSSFEVVPVSASSSFRVSVYSTAAIRLLVRVRGYYTVSPYVAGGGTYTPVAPATVVNDVPLAAGGSTTVTVTGANGIPAPAGVAAVALNVIADRPSATGWLQAHPAGPRPSGNSSLDYQTGRTAADFEVVPVSASGQVTVYSASATRVLVRLRGYYTPAQTPSGADWSQYRNGPAHLGTNPSETVLSPATVRDLGQAWTSSIGGTVSAPVAAGGTVYAGSTNGNAVALDAVTGATRWTTAVGGTVTGAAVAGGTVYAGSSSGSVRGLDAGTGATRWTASTAGVRGAPTVADGVVYAGTGGGVYALDAATGARRWTAITGVSVSDSPTVADGMVYAIGSDLKVYALDAGTGATAWTAVFGPQPDPSGGPVFCVDPSARTAPAVAGGIVYVAGWCDGTVRAFNAASGATVWTLSGRLGPSAPAVANGIVYVVSEAGLQALDAATGSSVWTVNTSATAPVLANGVLYHGAGSGVLVARDPATGAQLWSDLSTPGRSANGYLSVVVGNGAVYAARDLGAVTAHHP